MQHPPGISYRYVQALNAGQQVCRLQKVGSTVSWAVSAAAQHGHPHIRRDGIEPMQRSDHAAHYGSVRIGIATSEQCVLQSRDVCRAAQ